MILYKKHALMLGCALCAILDKSDWVEDATTPTIKLARALKLQEDIQRVASGYRDMVKAAIKPKSLLTAAVLASLATAAHAQQAKLPVGVAVDGHAGWSSFSQAVQTPTMILCYVDLRLPKARWVESARYEAGQIAKGITPIVGLPMASQGDEAGQSFRDIASGKNDAVINGIFQAFIDAGFKGFHIRPGFEMNGTWMPWSVTPGNSADFIAAFQRIAALAHAFKGALISVTWNPNVGGSLPLASFYPGNQAVDVIGLDTYGVPLNNPMSPGDTSGQATLKATMQFAADKGKFFAIPEAGSADATFPTQLGIALAGAPTKIAYIAVWDTDAACGGCAFGPGDARATAWRGVIAAVQGNAVVSTVLAQSAPSVVPFAQPAPLPAAPPPYVPSPELGALQAQIDQLTTELAAAQPSGDALDVTALTARLDAIPMPRQ